MNIRMRAAGRSSGTRRFAPGLAVLGIAGAIGVAAPVASAFAEPIYNLYDNWSNIGDNGITVNAGGETYSGYPIGPQATTITLTQSSSAYSVLTWCIDFTHNIYVPGNYSDYNLVPLSKAGLGSVSNYLNQPQPNNLATNQTAENEVNFLMDLGNTLLKSPGTNNTNDIGSAIQIAIWSVLYSDMTYSGATTTVQDDVNTYLAEAMKYDTVEWGGDALISMNGEQQLAYGTDAVPEPASLILLASGLIGFGTVFRRKRAKSRTT
jgi:hypothetical protein